MTHTIDTTQTVADLVLDHSACAQVFKRHHIDFCCRGDMSIEEAAKSKGLDVGMLAGELSAAIAQRAGGPGEHADPRELSTPRLVAFIVARHHEYLRQVFPFARGLALKVSRVHGDHNPKLRDLQVAFEDLANELLPHLDHEEQTLFPALMAAEADKAKVRPLLETMNEDHLTVAAILERIRTASDGFTLPDWACNSYRTLFAELQQLESDVFTHVHLENHVLRPRFT